MLIKRITNIPKQQLTRLTGLDQKTGNKSQEQETGTRQISGIQGSIATGINTQLEKTNSPRYSEKCGL